ncbi:MAG: 30S ribosomal protein S8 [Deltaproteobacteria bacterium]|jgi:small subunit ribosomal protein S8|nr:30S ribosomal protein S8 [Deltaproteobacteria bacterium]MBN2686960.1 30S ribosomal protein S8 [Deltaproteobacteria bacterium]
MGMSDPIADMLTRVRNANHRKFKSTDVLFSRMNLNIAKVLKKTGYINGFEVKRDGKRRMGLLRIYLRYSTANERIITDIQRVSKPGRRFYVGSKEIPEVLNGYGIAVLSTSRGIMTDKEARDLNVGGEILCNVW